MRRRLALLALLATLLVLAPLSVSWGALFLGSTGMPRPLAVAVSIVAMLAAVIGGGRLGHNPRGRYL